MATGGTDRVFDGEDAAHRVVLMLSSHTFLGAVVQQGFARPASASGFVVTLSLYLQLINDGLRLQHRLPLPPVRVEG